MAQVGLSFHTKTPQPSSARLCNAQHGSELGTKQVAPKSRAPPVPYEGGDWSTVACVFYVLASHGNCWFLWDTASFSCMLLKVFRYSIPHLQPSCLSVVYIQGLQQGKANKVISNMCLNLMDSDSVTNDIWEHGACRVVLWCKEKKKIKSFLVSNSHKAKQGSGRWDLHQELCLCRLAFVPGSFLCKPWRDVLLVTRATK